jgi:dihydropteroate synthase
MGIVNVTPDSFSDGGKFKAVESAVAHARRLAQDGADIIDFGGESTRPGFTPVSAETEMARVLPVLDALAGLITVPLSIDTSKASVAREALARGVTIVNDIWGLQGDPAMAGTVADKGATVVVMHNRASKDESVAIGDDMRRFFETSLAVAEWAGIARKKLILDPGIGFGKTPRQQLEALAAIPHLCEFDLPILVGLSRKSFLGNLSGSRVNNRLAETIAANLAAFSLGASIFRVHDVAEHVAALAVFSAIGLPREPAP